MFDISKEKIVKRGKCFYDSTEVICYYAWYNSPGSRGVFRAGSRGFLAIEESVKDAVKVVGVRWLN